jgi:hypothetical protein
VSGVISGGLVITLNWLNFALACVERVFKDFGVVEGPLRDGDVIEKARTSDDSIHFCL